MKRTLALKREVVAELAGVDLREVAGATVQDLSFSCLTYVSCNPADCLLTERYTICLES